MFCPKCEEEFSWDVMVCPTLATLIRSIVSQAPNRHRTSSLSLFLRQVTRV
jgi:ABC-type phosphate transport system permease subunit